MLKSIIDFQFWFLSVIDWPSDLILIQSTNGCARMRKGTFTPIESGSRSETFLWWLSYLPQANEVCESYFCTGVCLSTGAKPPGTHPKGMHTPQARTPPGTHTPPRQILWDAVNQRVVRILLECILVSLIFSLVLWSDQCLKVNPHRTKAKVKAKIFFDVCQIFIHHLIHFIFTFTFCSVWMSTYDTFTQNESECES